jgi:hypothetical protein
LREELEIHPSAARRYVWEMIEQLKAETHIPEVDELSIDSCIESVIERKTEVAAVVQQNCDLPSCRDLPIENSVCKQQNNDIEAIGKTHENRNSLTLHARWILKMPRGFIKVDDLQ